MKEAAQARLSLHMPKCHIVGNHMSRLIFISRDFGSTIIQVEPILVVLPKLMKHTSNEVREETKELLSEIYRWTGPNIKQHLEELNTAQVIKLAKIFFYQIKICI